MAAVPLSLTWTNLTTPVNALDINQLGIIMCRQIAGQVDMAGQATVLTGTVNPDKNVGIFFNTAAQQFMVWDSVTGKYVPMSGVRVGDTKDTYIANDEIPYGWILLDGRTIATIPGISSTQRAVLVQLFGTTLPVVNSIRQISGLPANGTISGISVPATAPADGVIGALPVSGTYNQAEVEDIRDDTEVLRDSTEVTADALRQLRDKTESIRDALAGSNSTLGALVTKIFVGYP